MSKIMNQVPGWKTSKLERSSSRSDLNETHTSREERTMSASAATEPVAVDAVGGGGDENKNKKKKKINKNENIQVAKNALSALALAAASGEQKISRTFGPGPVGLALQSTKWIPVGDIFDTVGSAMVREFTLKNEQTMMGTGGTFEEKKKKKKMTF